MVHIAINYPLEVLWGRGFDSLHLLHFSTLQSERFTAEIKQWGF